MNRVTSYINEKLEAEYHQLALWYFVSFMFGIVFYFGSADSPSLSRTILTFIFIVVAGLIPRLTQQLSLKFCSYLIASFCVGIFVSQVRILSTNTNEISNYIVTEVTGKVESVTPTIRGSQLTLNHVTLADKKYTVDKVRVNIKQDFGASLNFGDEIKLEARLFPLQSSMLPNTYDFGFYLRMLGIGATGYALDAPKIIKKQDVAGISSQIQRLRSIIYQRLLAGMDKGRGNFAAAILIGETKGINVEMAKRARYSGIAHILSVSGLHLSLVAMIFFVSARMLMNCSNFLAYNFNIKLLSALISLIGSFLYLLISGSKIAATRAFIMTAIFIIAIMLGRSPYPLRSLCLAAFVMLSFSPEYLFHPSFQLSFSAVLCLISGYEIYLKNQSIIGNSKGVFAWVKLYVIGNVYSSFLASIITAPFVIYHFYKIATYSVLMNLVAVPIMSFFMMPLGIIALVLTPFGSEGFILRILDFFILIVDKTAEWIISLPNAIWNTGYISSDSLLVFTFGLFWLCFWQSSWRFFGFLIMLVSVIMMSIPPKPELIYDHRLKNVGYKDQNGKLAIYVNDKIPNFTRDYWANWFGQEEVEVAQKPIRKKNNLFITATGKKIALSYWSCQDADVQLIISKKLKCSNSPLTLGYETLENSKTILIFCDRGRCRVQ